MTVEPMTDAELAELREQHAKWGLSTNPRTNVMVDRLLARLDAERTRADAAEAERDAALARAMPEGWVAVPAEPMPEMVAAWWSTKNGFHFHDEPPPTDTSDYAAYRAMIAATPAPPTPPQRRRAERWPRLTTWKLSRRRMRPSRTIRLGFTAPPAAMSERDIAPTPRSAEVCGG